MLGHAGALGKRLALRLLLVLVVVLGVAGDRVLEFAQPGPELLAQAGQPLRPKDQQHDQKHDQKIGGGIAEHSSGLRVGSSKSSGRPSSRAHRRSSLTGGWPISGFRRTREQEPKATLSSPDRTAQRQVDRGRQIPPGREDRKAGAARMP